MINSYQSLAMRTSQWQPNHPNYRKAEHRTYGEISVAGETGELVDAVKKRIFHGRRDDEKIVNEGGDVCWSVACLCEVHGIEFGKIAQSGIDSASNFDIEDDALDMFRYAGFAISASQCEKMDELGRNLANVIACVVSIAADAGATLEDVLAANVTKLRKRYPDGYSEAASIARADVEGTPTANHRCVATIDRGTVSTAPGAIAEGEG
jgi:NTP pyrophosphatase (non-canonical NTP hydrolase)